MDNCGSYTAELHSHYQFTISVGENLLFLTATTQTALWRESQTVYNYGDAAEQQFTTIHH